MTDLSHDARELVDATREADAPSVSERERVKKSVLGRVALAAAAASSATGAASAAAGSAASVAPTATIAVAKAHVSIVWIVTSLAVGGTAGVGVVAFERVRQPVTSMASHDPAPSHPAPRAASAAPPVGDTAVEPESTAAPAIMPEPVAPNPSKSTSSGATLRGTLGAEVLLLRDAQDALRDGRPWRAIEVLDDHARRFPSGVLAEERRAVRAIAVCQAKPGADSRSEAASFLKSAPDSPLVDRVRAACFDTPEGANR